MTRITQQPDGATPLTADELRGLKLPGISTHGALNAVEAVNIEQGLRWLARRPRSFDPLTDDAAREVHRRLFGDVWAWGGTYRATEKNIGVAPWQISTEMRYCLDDAKLWLTDAVFDPPEAVARLHHRLVAIHPFPNGNGRWSRIMADEFLLRLNPDMVLDWSQRGTLQSEGANRRRYIDALRAADRHDYAPLIDFISDALS